MAKKETKRQRKEVAKARRLEMQRKAARRRKMRKVYSFALVILIVGAIVAAVVLSNKKSADDFAQQNSTINATAATLGCGADPFGVVKQFPNEGRNHVPTAVKYSTNPPTSGDHLGQWGNTGVIPTQPQEEMYVHNLEHGHVGIWYDPARLPATVKATLEDFTSKNATFTFMAPRANIGGAVLALASWQHSLGCGPGMQNDPTNARKLAQAYFDAYSHKGPEDVAGTPRK